VPEDGCACVTDAEREAALTCTVRFAPIVESTGVDFG
jgi:hypothetical protein